MKGTESYLFLGVFAMIAAASAGFYYMEAYDPPVPATVRQAAEESLTTTAAAYVTSTTEAAPATTTTSEPASPSSTTATLAAAPATTATTLAATTTTAARRPSYLDRYVGRGYRQAYIDIQFFCPSCAPAVASNVQGEPGVIGKSIGWGQDVSWVIYNPKVAKIDRILELAASSGGASLVNDTAI